MRYYQLNCFSLETGKFTGTIYVEAKNETEALERFDKVFPTEYATTTGYSFTLAETKTNVNRGNLGIGVNYEIQ